MNLEEFIEIANSGKGDLKELCKIGEEILKNLDGHERGRILGTLGNLNYVLGNFEKAENFYHEALLLYLKLSQDDESYIRYVVGCLFNLGNLYHTSGRYMEAKECYRDALETCNFLKNEEFKFEILSALGLLEIKLGNYREAEKLLREAIEIKRDVKVLNNLAVTLIRLGKKDEAKKVLLEALKIDKNFAVFQNLLALGEMNVEELENLDLPIEFKAKLKYLKAKKLEKEGKDASREFLEAGCLGFLAIRNGCNDSINYMHCFDKVIESNSELSKVAEELKKIILRCYYRADIEVDGLDLWNKIRRGDFGDGILSILLRRIADDVKGFL